MSRRKIRILSDPTLLLTGIVCVISTAIPCFWAAYTLNDPSMTNTVTDRIGSQAIFVGLGVGMIIVGILCLPRWGANIVLTEETIKFHAPFMKSVIHTYNDYGYVGYAYYLHFGIRVDYIVLASVRLTDYQKCHINQVKCTNEIIKIRCRKTTVQQLRVFLPPTLKRKLNFKL